MALRYLLFPVVLLFTSLPLYPQSPLYMPSNIAKAYQTGTRVASGKPGPSYWQNTADYAIKVSFDPETRQVSGTVSILYINNSPDTLKQLWFKLYPNLYQKGAPRDSYIAPEDVSDGVSISQLTVGDKNYNLSEININGTNMPVRISPLIPHGNVNVNIRYSYTLNKGSHNRTGQVDQGSYFIAYFFPRIAVYDDIDGWNKNPYTGSQEFYNDFCNFSAEVTVPSGFVVWATGDLRNASSVLGKKYFRRLETAETTDRIVTVIDSTDIRSGDITASDKPTNTWKFEAKNVTDFVFALSDHYMWRASSVVVDQEAGRRTRVDAAFNPSHKDFLEVSDFARKTVEVMSHTFPKWPFPYSHETVFDGLDQMEYPMMVNDNPLDNRRETISLTDHEIFHTMFPFYMGINETKYGWMDEGWATIGEWIISKHIDTAYTDEYAVGHYAYGAGSESDLPIMTPTTFLTGFSNLLNSYSKPGLAYFYLKDLLGDETFFKALHFYIHEWNGKHPGPYDFFNCFNTGSGRNLNWFWKAWFFDHGQPDLSISSVERKDNNYRVTVTAVGTKPVPVDLNLIYEDHSRQLIHRSVEVWQAGSKSIVLTFKADKPLKELNLGSTYIPDSNPKDNVYKF